MKKLLRLTAVMAVLGFTSWFAPSAKAAFCNTTGFVGCDATHGTACSTQGVSKRCVAPGPCEWGVCRCQSGAWNCIY